MMNARVLVHFAEEVLTVNQLQGPTPKRFELDAKALEFRVLPLGNNPDEIGFRQPANRLKALRDSAFCPRTRNDKLHLGEIRELAVAEVGRILIGKKITNHRVGPQECENLQHAL